MLWYQEEWSGGTRFSVKIKNHIYSEQTPFQRLDVYESYDYGRFFSLDGYIMLTEKDEFIYHDMIVHPALAVKPDVKKALVVGGGDGGTVRELLRYKSIDRIDMVDIDERVVLACRQYFPVTSAGLADSRVNLVFGDGLEFVRQSEDSYDLIIVDSTDPVGPGEGLFTESFYRNCFRVLSAGGILVNQNESPYYEKNLLELQRAYKKIKTVFPIALAYQAHIPTYASGHWLFGFASKQRHPLRDVDIGQWKKLGLKTRYYNPSLHFGAFALPTYVKEYLRG